MPSAGITVSGVGQLVSTLDAVRDAYFQVVRYVVQATAEYSAHVEYGTYKASAQPYMRPAASDARSSFSSIAQGAQNSIEAIVQAVAAYMEMRAKQHVPVATGHLRSTISFEKA